MIRHFFMFSLLAVMLCTRLLHPSGPALALLCVGDSAEVLQPTDTSDTQSELRYKPWQPAACGSYTSRDFAYGTMVYDKDNAHVATIFYYKQNSVEDHKKVVMTFANGKPRSWREYRKDNTLSHAATYDLEGKLSVVNFYRRNGSQEMTRRYGAHAIETLWWTDAHTLTQSECILPDGSVEKATYHTEHRDACWHTTMTAFANYAPNGLLQSFGHYDNNAHLEYKVDYTSNKLGGIEVTYLAPDSSIRFTQTWHQNSDAGKVLYLQHVTIAPREKSATHHFFRVPGDAGWSPSGKPLLHLTMVQTGNSTTTHRYNIDGSLHETCWKEPEGKFYRITPMAIISAPHLNEYTMVLPCVPQFVPPAK